MTLGNMRAHGVRSLAVWCWSRRSVVIVEAQAAGRIS
jgi:hypothetical protein